MTIWIESELAQVKHDLGTRIDGLSASNDLLRARVAALEEQQRVNRLSIEEAISILGDVTKDAEDLESAVVVNVKSITMLSAIGEKHNALIEKIGGGSGDD